MLSSLDGKRRAQRSEGSCPRPHSSPRATAEVLPTSRAGPGNTISFLHVHFDSRKEALKKCRPGGDLSWESVLLARGFLRSLPSSRSLLPGRLKGPLTLLPLYAAPYTGNRITPRVQTETGQQPLTPEYGEPSYTSSSELNPKPKLTWKEVTYLF